MNALWSSLHSMGPLLRCLPSDTWKAEEVGGVANWRITIKIIRAPSLDGWARFFANSARVKKLDLDIGAAGDPSVAQLRTLRMYMPPSSSPFSGLRSLVLRRVVVAAVAYIPIFLNPRLEVFSMLDPDSDVLCSTLGFLGDQCSGLRELAISGWVAEAVTLIPHFKNLRKIASTMPLNTSTIISHVATSTYLTCLNAVAPRMVGPHNFLPFLERHVKARRQLSARVSAHTGYIAE
ncbi:hypothetical protein PsYK624_105450 [Phanerochaete sordida]|uniref:Uncharacterized protein n=1 Tax=Phanerochaete sordida TaxID=48140 RepID=A0A9P3LGA7_9APHY|nr:hypothetical protein PsYK624_105450 [Phanerochaete sordida]